jgi:hypothetical protein
MKNNIPGHSVGLQMESVTVPDHILGTFLNGMATVRFITSLCPSVRTKEGCTHATDYRKFRILDFRKKKVIEHKMCVLISSTTFV